MSLGSGTLTFGYDPAGNLLSENRPNGTSTSYSYNQVNLPTEINHRKALASFAEITYAYDALGNVTTETNSLLSAPVLQGKVITGAYNSANQIRSWGDQTFQHDPDGNLTAITGGTDMNAVYDHENRLASVTRNGTTTTHAYNALGQRAKSTTGSQVTRYHYDAEGRLLFTTNAAGTTTACYFYFGKRLVAMRDQSGGYFYYHFDKNGNTLVLTDSSGNMAALYAYTPFGGMLLENSSVMNPFTYVGAYGVMDEGNGLFYMKNRHYNSATGRFLQKDPLRFAAGTNVYAYGNNNPVKYIDPDGTLVKEMAAGAASSAAYWLLTSNPVGWSAVTAFAAGWATYSVGSSLYSMIGRIDPGVARRDEYDRTFIARVDSYDNDAVAQRSQFGHDGHRDAANTCVDGFNILQKAPLPVPAGPAGDIVNVVQDIVLPSPEYMDNASDTENVGEPADYGENEE